jgi:hypothetical protein
LHQFETAVYILIAFETEPFRASGESSGKWPASSWDWRSAAAPRAGSRTSASFGPWSAPAFCPI